MNLLVDKLKKKNIPFKVVGGSVVVESQEQYLFVPKLEDEIEDLKAKIAKLKKKYRSREFKYELDDLKMFNKSQLLYLHNLGLISDEDYNKVK